MKRLLLQIFAWLAILVGAGLMLQPTVSQYLTRRKSTAAPALQAMYPSTTRRRNRSSPRVMT